MRIVLSLVSYPFLPARTGGQKAVALFIKYLAQKVKLTCVGVESNSLQDAEGYELKNILPDSPLRYINPFYFFTLRRVLKETKAEMLIIEHPYYGWLASLLKWSTRIPLTVRSHNIEGLRFKSLGKWWWGILWHYERFTHRRADYNLFMQDNDKEYAITNFGLRPERCHTLSYGLEWKHPPAREEKLAASKQLRSLHNIAEAEHIILFNGIFNYPPNLHALERIVDTIDPWLQQQDFPYKIIICGRDIPPSLSNKTGGRIVYAGFVDDISLYFKGSDVFINPIIEGGGIKTKLVEALGYNLTSVSTRSGAVGISAERCDGKLFIAPDDDWNAFCKMIVSAALVKADTPPAFFEHFYWGNSVEKAVKFLGLADRRHLIKVPCKSEVCSSGYGASKKSI